MEMVWHEAVRKDCNVGALRRLEEMRLDWTDYGRGLEVRPSHVSANRPEKRLSADVGNVGMPWCVAGHGNGHPQEPCHLTRWRPCPRFRVGEGVGEFPSSGCDTKSPITR